MSIIRWVLEFKSQTELKEKRRYEVVVVNLLILGSVDEKDSDIDELEKGTSSIHSNHKQTTWFQESIESP